MTRADRRQRRSGERGGEAMGRTDVFRSAAVQPRAEPGETGTTWWCKGDIAAAVAEVSALAREAKDLRVRIEALKATIAAHAERRWLAYWASRRQQPASPVKLATEGGQAVLWVTQDRTVDYAPAEAAICELQEAIGSEPADWLVPKVTYGFNSDILAIEARDPVTKRRSTIQSILARRINPVLEELVASGQIERSQAARLLTKDLSQNFADSFLDRLPDMCEGDPAKLKLAVKALGGALVKFVKTE
jgi:hypothetical protein